MADLIDELRGLMAKATPGPWKVSETGATIRASHVYDPLGGLPRLCTTRITFGYDGNADQRAIDYALIVAAVNALPALLATLAEAERALEGAAAAIGDWSRPTGANGMTSVRPDHPLCQAATRARDVSAAIRAGKGEKA